MSKRRNRNRRQRDQPATKPPALNPSSSRSPGPSKDKFPLFTVLAAAGLIVALVVIKQARGRRNSPETTIAHTSGVEVVTTGKDGMRFSSNETVLHAFQPSPASILDRFTKLDLTQGNITAVQVQSVEQNFAELVNSGTNAIPAISQFLNRFEDIRFDQLRGGIVMHYTTLRLGLIDSLQTIGGPGAVSALEGVLSSTADPKEIAWTVVILEKLSPKTHRTAATAAIGQVLAFSDAELRGRDVRPLFQLLERYGDVDALPILEKTAIRWSYYRMMGLAKLPDSRGIPAITKELQNSAFARSSEGAFAWQMLAQIASDSPAAKAALIESARTGQVPDNAWAGIATGLAGDQQEFGRGLPGDSRPGNSTTAARQIHVAIGNQTFYRTPLGTLPAAKLDERRAVVEKLLSMRLSPTGTTAIEKARAELARIQPEN